MNLPAAGGAFVVRAGALTTLQDGGRPGWAHLGVPRSGALDRGAHRLANRLVGNPPDAAVLETTLDGVALRLGASAVLAVTGAPARVTVDGRPAGWGAPFAVRAGAVVEVGRAQEGVRSYVAVAGAWQAEAVLGSVATDLLSGLGPPPLTTGEPLRSGPPVGRVTWVDVAPTVLPGRPPAGASGGALPGASSGGASTAGASSGGASSGGASSGGASSGGALVLGAVPGPRHDWLTERGRSTLASGRWAVMATSNRIALRLEGPPVERHRRDELASEGIVTGAVQCLPDGQLVVFLADHPTTGGYPVVAVVDRPSLDVCAQARPGAAVTLRMLSP